ncbi:MAG TPA: DNA polymerase subunit beta [Nitrospiraceae bacterium]|nr:DNA polymerase subunit beta [Nitrospiraceae bacterium]
MNERAKINKAIALLREAANPIKIILFGSHARGEAEGRSDVDLLVVEAEVNDRVQEMVRLNRVLSPLRIAIDLLVVSKETFEYWASTPGNVYFQAVNEGQVLYEAA